jgi:3-hydroxybutyryl-CoA dehydrogenase
VFEATYQQWQACGKKPIRVQRDVSGYVGNRLQRAVMREALALLAEGTASAEDIDRAACLGFGLRLAARGPLEQRDVAGLELAVATQQNYEEVDERRFAAGTEYLQELVAAGHVGLASGRGFFGWDGQDPAVVQSDGDELLARVVALRGLGPSAASPPR